MISLEGGMMENIESSSISESKVDPRSIDETVYYFMIILPYRVMNGSVEEIIL
jgi:hypothetical protein